MNYFSDTINLLPDEILFFKNITNKQKDPIKKYMFSLKELEYIMKKISKFSISYKMFLNIASLNDKNLLLKFLCENYLNKQIKCNKDYEYMKKFIYIFFDYKNPIYDRHSYDTLWIYPNMNVKAFISDCLFEYDTQRTYLDLITLNKLITIFTSFTKYEYTNCDENISYLFEGLNYPSLVLANIDLYEKGYIEVVEDMGEIKIFLNKKNKVKQTSIFTQNRSLLKNYILEFINSKDNTKYCLSDFL